ncbi:hypothetical protein HFO55_34720 [Rhizobium leguminosarum]|uniref:hypothetical protein n=2 Tax=Rhizobium TaxID=379 RepID=UPI001C97FF15|nr:hypothetical protein [Rhizobium leguminosarum]MBY5572251.1 hypothetical protein [Rhizobium leguminosarum]MBY5578925.1 hypothetical protein [Rhizobium leguminosarum]
MGLKLEKARNEDGVFAASEVTGDDGPFQCPFCDIPVNRVPDHIRHGDDLRLRRHVPAYFRRNPGYEHGQCRYNVAGAVANIFAQAKAVEDELPIFDQEDGSYRFRLNIATALADRMRPLSQEDSMGRRIGQAWETGKLDQYCRSAVGLANLWNMVEGATDRRGLADSICFVDRDRVIEWKDFCFAPKNYSRLLRHAVKRRGRHPVAVLVDVKEIIPHAESGRYILSCASSLTRDTRKSVSPTIFATPTAVRGLLVGHQYLMFGDWTGGKVNKWSPKDNPSFEIEYHGVTLSLVRKAQWAPIDVPGEGDERS